MNEQPPHAEATEVFIVEKKPRRPLDIPPRINTDDMDEVWGLAVRLQGATARRLTTVTHAEMRAMARLAASGGVALSQVADLIRLIDLGGSREDVMAKVGAIVAAVRPILEGASP